ncbi:MAG TPA: hypothetical protein VM283_00250, partial [Armatimonadota bacterium]|nr:hypothetical protein [Armatimonadota bacterium]
MRLRIRRRRNNNGSRQRRPTRILGVELNAFFYSRALMAMASALLLLVALSTRLIPERVSLEPGMESDSFIKVLRSTSYVDTEATEERRQMARDAVPDQYVGVPEAQGLVEQTINDIFRVVEEVRADPSFGDDQQARLAAVRDMLDVSLTDQVLSLLVRSERGALDRARSDALRLALAQMQKPIRSNTTDLEDARAAIGKAVEELSLTNKYQALVAEIASKALRPNLRYDDQTTMAQRKAAGAAVAEVR